MGFVLPPKSQVGVLDAEVAGEGQKVILSDGEQLNWAPPPPRPVMPDWSQIKSIRHYFGRTGYAPWPAWLYHPTEPARLVKNAEAAAELGVCYREATFEEKGRYGRDRVWDWKDDCLWRPTPYAIEKFDPQKPSHGKNYLPTQPNPILAQNALLEALIPTVTAAVVTALKSNGGAVAPASVDPAQWDAFLQFQAWQKTREVVDDVTAAADTEATFEFQDQAGNALAAKSDESEERELWLEEAKRKAVKVDGRWSLERIKSEVEKAA